MFYTFSENKLHMKLKLTKNDQIIVREVHFFDQNHSSVKGGQPCGTGLRGTEAHLNTYLHSKFHQDWSRNAQVMTRKHQTLITEDR